jgi:hypothetical protein
VTILLRPYYFNPIPGKIQKFISSHPTRPEYGGLE